MAARQYRTVSHETKSYAITHSLLPAYMPTCETSIAMHDSFSLRLLKVVYMCRTCSAKSSHRKESSCYNTTCRTNSYVFHTNITLSFIHIQYLLLVFLLFDIHRESSISTKTKITKIHRLGSKKRKSCLFLQTTLRYLL